MQNGKYAFMKSNEKIKSNVGNFTIETVANYQNFKTFCDFPLQLYKNNSYWVPPFWKEQKDFFKANNPFWNHSECRLFIAKKNNEILGRIAAIIDHKFCETIGEKIGYFGFFESIQDYDCAKALFQSAENWLSSKNMNKIRGPIDGRVDIGLGFLLNYFDTRASLLSPYTPEYYIKFAEKYNMKKVRDFITYYIDLSKPLPNKLKEKARVCPESGFKIRPFNRIHTQKELKWWIDLFLESFENHWGYVPVSGDEVKSRFGIKQIRCTVDSGLFLVVEYKDKPVAFLWSTPDYNQVFRSLNGQLGPYQLLKFFLMKKQVNAGKLHFIGIQKEFRNKDLASFLNYETLVEMKKRGYISAEIGVIDEKNNIAHTTIAITGAKPYKRFRVFEKNIRVGGKNER